MYLLKLSLRPWRLAPMSQFFSAIAVSLLLFLMGFLFWMQRSLSPVLIRLQGEQVVTAYLNPSINTKDEAKVVDSIRLLLGAQSGMEIKFVGSRQFISTLKTQYPELGRELEGLGSETHQIVPRYVTLSGILPSSTLEKVKTVAGIESVESTKDRYRQVVGAFSALRWMSRILMGGICLALLTGLIHLSRLNAYLHEDALKLLQHLGASQKVLIFPGAASGFSVGLLGGLLALLAWMTVGIGLTQHVRSLSSLLKGMPSAPSNLALILLIGGAMAGQGSLEVS